MLQGNLRLSRLAAVLAASLAMVVFPALAAPADDLKEAQKLYSSGRLQPSLDKVEGYLKAQPRDPQGRFLKGLILTEQKRTNDAIAVFTGLTEDYPELPEPYNNLAVLYASQGNYDKAKSALELAIHTHPSYATAHENLGDIYAQLASRAYDRALSLDKSNTSAQLKLSMVKDLFTSQKVAGATDPTKAAKAEPAKAAKTEPKPEPAKAEPKAEPAKVEAPKAEPAKAEPAKPAKAEPKPAAATGDEAQVTAAVQAWAAAWGSKDVKGYLAAYAPDFETPGGESRDAWAKARTERIEKPKTIEVSVQIKSVKVTGNEALVTFRQNYRSDALKSSNTKTLKLVKAGDKWLIKQERVGG
jgi:Flp pilus assembly protein TadD/ketosteroid isomerase-like protein